MSVRPGVRKAARFFCFLVVLCLLPFSAHAQNITTVTGTITDPNGVPYSNGRISAQLTPNGVTPTIGGQTVSAFTSAGLDVTGSFVMNLASNAVISPPGTQWQFTVGISPGISPPAGTGPQSFVVTITISGASQSISATLNAAAPKLTNIAGGASITYVTNPPSGPYVTGNTYYVTSTNQFFCATSTSVIIPCAGPSGVTGPPSANLMAAYYIQPGETAAALVDYSGNGRTATGTVGTAPTVGAAGGLACSGAGAVSLPASLNSALTVAAYVTLATPGSPVDSFIIMGNNVGGFDSFGFFANGSFIPTYSNISNSFAVTNSTVGGSTSYLNFRGNGSVIFTVAAGGDSIYLNGLGSNYVSGLQNSSLGSQSAGNYQICGAAIVAYAPVGLTIHALYFYSTVLTTAQIQQLNQWMNFQGTNGGNPPNLTNPTLTTSNTIVAYGDSITTTSGLANTSYVNEATLINSYNVINRGISGDGAYLEIVNQPYSEGTMFSPIAGENLLFLNLGSNDCFVPFTSAQALTFLSQMVHYWIGLGGKVVVSTLLDRVAQSACNEAVDTGIRASWRGWGAVGMADFMSDPNIGASGANASTNFFNADKIHPNQAASYNDQTPIFQRLINAVDGHQDFSSATTYITTSAAPVATTALSETGNTATVTFAATPANCQVGNPIVIAGTTATGVAGAYNNATSGNPQAWYIITRGTTTVTFYMNTTTAGTQSVAGTAVCPQMQDNDVYAILGTCAGICTHTLETSIGYTTQNIWRSNSNTSPWIITPFGAETINGLTGYILPPGQTVCLQSVLVSPTAGGNNWQTCSVPTTVQTVVTSGSAYTNATTGFTSVVGTAGQTLQFPVLASTRYQMTCNVVWSASAATAGPKFQLTGPGSPTSVQYSVMQAVTATTDGTASAVAFSTSLNASGVTVVTPTNEPATITMGLVNGATAGTVVLQAAAQGVGTLTIQPGASCTMTQVQ